MYYYDCGQSVVTKLLHKAFIAVLGSNVEFALKVRPGPVNYKSIKVADIVFALLLID